MQTEVIMAGFGGQGLMLIGQILALAGLEEKHEVTWLPSYGPEMRGGTANCTVIVGDKPIGSPLIPSPRAAVVMNRPSLERFAPTVKPGGVLVVDSSLIPIRSGRPDIREFRIRADDLATEAGSRKCANLVMLGALVGMTDIVRLDTVAGVVRAKLGRKAELLEINLKSLQLGHDLAKAGKSDD